tara:strand:+ start:700 stop:1581 length:882 start_codon:yes stop_codon:yes gene_type:complete
MKLSILIISYQSLEKLKNCLNSIGNHKEILIIENSNIQKIKDDIEINYKNCKVILNNSNLGYAKASNIGFKHIKTDYVLLLNTDVVITENQINKIEEELNGLNDDFTLASPLSDDLIDFNQNNQLDKFLTNKLDSFNNKNKISQIELVKGCSLIVNLKKFVNSEVFDDNYFFFFEEMDLCRKIKKKGEKIFVLNNIKITHKSAQGLDENLNFRYHNFRNWNYFWGRFYYFKKNYGYFYAFVKHFGKLFRFAFNIIRYYFFSKSNFLKNKYRFLGLLNSIMGRNSNLSVKILEE